MPHHDRRHVTHSSMKSWYEIQRQLREEEAARKAELIRANTESSTDPRVRLGMMPCPGHPTFAEVDRDTFDAFMQSEHSGNFVEVVEAPAYYEPAIWWYNVAAFNGASNPGAAPRDHMVSYRALIDGVERYFVWAPWVSDPMRK